MRYGLASSMLVVAFCVACTTVTPEPVVGMINAGDDIDGMIITTTEEIDWPNSINFKCDFENTDEEIKENSFPCYASPGDDIFFGSCYGILYDTDEEAESKWSPENLKVTVDDRPLNLPSFGYLDMEAETYDEEYLRLWNLKIENITVGSHVIRCDFLEDEMTGYSIFNLVVLDKPETFAQVSSDVPARLGLYTSTRAGMNYVMYIPGDYGVNPDRKWPLILYLHGADRVNGSVRTLQSDYILSTLSRQDYFPFIVLAPQGHGEYEFWATDEMDDALMTLLQEIEENLTIDTTREYLTGVSAGGNGTWAFGLKHPGHFAALAPIMGYWGWPSTIPDNICDLEDVPVWAFHGAADEVIPLEAEQSLVDALEACGGNVQMTVYPELGHDLDLARIYSADLYTWFLDQP